MMAAVMCQEVWQFYVSNGSRSDFQVITPHHQTRTLQSLRQAGEGIVYTETMWALKNKEEVHEYSKTSPRVSQPPSSCS